MKHHALVLLPLLAACASEPTEAVWLRSFSADWAGANHRLSFLALRPTDDGVTAGFVGGASTTGTIFEDACLDRDTCNEIPAFDQGLVEAEVVRATTSEATLATGTASLDADADGAEIVVRVELPVAARGTPWAWVGGFTIDGTVPLGEGAASCYDPRYGWLPTRLAIEVGPATLSDDRRAVDVPVSARFASGVSREDMRACLDAVAADAHALVDVDVVVLVGEIDATARAVGGAAAWPERGEAQSIDDVGDTTVDFTDPDALVGWSALDFAFHEVVDPGRGAYLRTLQVEADPAGDVAFGFATSTSAFTQLSGFDYRFTGTALELAVEAEATVTTYADDALLAEIDAEGRAVLHELPPAE